MSLPLSAPLSRLKGSNFPGYTLIDVLKIDIEGAEFDTLTTFLAAHKSVSPFSSTTLRIGQLQLELHAVWRLWQVLLTWLVDLARSGWPAAIPDGSEHGVRELQSWETTACRGKHS